MAKPTRGRPSPPSGSGSSSRSRSRSRSRSYSRSDSCSISRSRSRSRSPSRPRSVSRSLSSSSSHSRNVSSGSRSPHQKRLGPSSQCSRVEKVGYGCDTWKSVSQTNEGVENELINMRNQIEVQANLIADMRRAIELLCSRIGVPPPKFHPANITRPKDGLGDDDGANVGLS